MIVTAYTAKAQWQAELFEWSWLTVGQPGELVRIAPGATASSPPRQLVSRTVAGPAWRPHPFTDDDSAAYGFPASLLAWLLTEQLAATVLLAPPDCVFDTPVNGDVAPGRVIAQPLTGLATDEAGPFGLPLRYEPLAAFCVRRDLPLTPIRLPALIHSADLLRILPRWLELLSLLRATVEVPAGQPMPASEVGLTIALAEAGLAVETRSLAGTTVDTGEPRQIIEYEPGVASADGEIVFDPLGYQPWAACHPEQAPPGPGRTFLTRLQAYATLREATGHLERYRPVRRAGVREARVANRMLLEVPGQPEEVTLNASASEIWTRCDGERTLAGIVDDLAAHFEEPRTRLAADVEAAVRELRAVGALAVEIAPA